MTMPAGLKRLFGILSLALGIWALAACSEPKVLATPETPQPTVEAATELIVYNWDTYIDPSILSDFEAEFGVTVSYTTYANNEDMLASVIANPGKYDIVIPTDYMVAQMRREGRLAALNKANIPNIKNIDPDFLSPSFDPGNRYCLPYQWGTMGIGYDPALTGREITGWADFFDPAFRGKVSLLEDGRLSLGITLLYLGYSPNTTDPSEIAAAKNFLVDHNDHIYAYAPDTGQDLLVNGEVTMAFEWNGDIFQIQEENPNFQYVIPREGSLFWMDGMCILADAPHKELAEKFINYLLEPEVGARLSNYVRYATPNLASMPLINESDRNNLAIYPSAEVRSRLFSIADVGAETAAIYDQAMQDVLASQP